MLSEVDKLVVAERVSFAMKALAISRAADLQGDPGMRALDRLFGGSLIMLHYLVKANQFPKADLIQAFKACALPVDLTQDIVDAIDLGPEAWLAKQAQKTS